jgi:hypothetical protein
VPEHKTGLGGGVEGATFEVGQWNWEPLITRLQEPKQSWGKKAGSENGAGNWAV